MKRKLSNLMIGAGALLLAAALVLTGRNLMDEARAGRDAADIAGQLEELEAGKGNKAYLTNPDMPMPTQTVDGHEYIGMLDVPALELSLPVMSDWSYPAMKLAPCRYQGSAYKDDLIIMAHDYKHHFGQLKNLPEDSEIVFTDVEENEFRYQVREIEVLEPTDIEEMESGDWDLTLFTCTKNGQARLTLRCDRVE